MIQQWRRRIIYSLLVLSLLVPASPARAETAEQDSQTTTVATDAVSEAIEVEKTHEPVLEASSIVPTEIINAPPPEVLAIDQVPENTSTQAVSIAPPQVPTSAPFSVSSLEAVLLSAFKLSQTRAFDHVELHNTTDSMTSLEGMEIHLSYVTESDEAECVIGLNGFLRPNSYVSYIATGTSEGSYQLLGCQTPAGPVIQWQLQLMRRDQVTENITLGIQELGSSSSKQWERSGWTSTYRTGLVAKDFKSPSIERTLYTSMIYQPPKTPSLQFLEVFPRPMLCSSGDENPVCRPYIKLKNTGSEPVDLRQFRLRSGMPFQAASRYNTSSLSGSLSPSDFVVISRSADDIPLMINQSDGAVWLEDAFGVQTYPNNDTPYHDADLVSQAGKSWALDGTDGTWRWTVPSPFTELNQFVEPGKGTVEENETDNLKPCADNQYRSGNTNRCRLISTSNSTLTPCRDDQYRSEETNRCRTAVTAVSTLTPCKDGQYRSETTNRCRSIAATAAATSKPCDDNQFRNPASGRCKKIASVDDILPACVAGKERNPETNRCRTIVSNSIPNTAFAVAPIKEGVKQFIGWWALGAIGIAAVGYAAWEWRREVGQFARKISPFSRNDK